MNRYVVTVEGVTYGRITRQQAKKLYKTEPIFAIPCKMRPGNIVCNMAQISPDRDFEKWDAEYRYYNCHYNECGYYPAYYCIIL